MASIDHNPQGDPCAKCGSPAIRHRVGHHFTGECCSLPESNHRIRNDDYRERHQLAKHTKWKEEKHDDIYLGIDGEGHGRVKHLYTFVGVSNETGDRTWSIENPKGIESVDFLDFLLTLPHTRCRVFGYSLNYDLTKGLEGLDNESLFYLFRPELRQRTGKNAVMGPRPVLWEGYSLNLQGTKFSVARGGKRIVIWDIFKFYQSKFVGALKDWKVGDEKLWTRMSDMKDKRGEFDRLIAEGKITDKDIRRYCFEECAAMAQLSHRLVDAHDAVGLKLRSFYGAGSTGGAMLNVMKARDYIAPPPDEMLDAVACGFFGGRFENAYIGAISEPDFSFDISSAYPYQIYHLPCLTHGKWKRVTRESHALNPRYRLALIHYGLGKPEPKHTHWGPFPFRMPNGSSCFPIESGGGWVWRDEYVAGAALFSHVRFREAWVYETDCTCQPFTKVADYYKERVRIGKEGPGIVLKLGINSGYGKFAQSIGNAIFNSWIYAGLITSGCRAQVLELMARLTDPRSLLMVATDGVKTLEDISTPVPRDTGTFDCKKKDSDTFVPLGGWERELEPKGVFLARPGVYFPLSPTKDELKKVRGRGVGKAVLYENWERIVKSWEKHGLNEVVRVKNVTRFCGALSSISYSASANEFRRASGKPGACKEKPGEECRHASCGNSAPAYGEWVTREVALSFTPTPKRESLARDGRSLVLRRMVGESAPYDRAIVSHEALELKRALLEATEQPDSDLTEYE